MQQNFYGNNIIITDSSSNLRALGRNALAGKWQSAIIAVIVYTLCVQLPPAILNTLFGIDMGELYSMNMGYSYNVGVDSYSTVYNSMPAYSPLSGIYSLLVTGAMDLGLTLFFLAMFRRQIVGIGDVFLGFERYGKALGLFLFQGLFILLWSLLFIVPGIIAAIRYSQAFFILADDPNKGIRQCMDESKMMMRGNKAKYFCLSLSFIGWGILASIPEALYLSGFMTVLFDIVGALCMAPVIAYIYSTQAGFYEILAGHLIKETQPAPIDPEAIPAAMRQPANPVPPQPQAPVNPVPPQPQVPVNPVPPQPQAPVNPVPPQPQAPVNPVPPQPQAPANPIPPQPQAPANPVPPQPQAPVDPIPQEVPPQPPVQPQDPEDKQ